MAGRTLPKKTIWDRVVIGADADCWPFIGTRDKDGYGKISVYLGNYKIAKVRAHRAAWMATHGPIPDGLFVCHHCDNPICCNPSHLFIGTVADNNGDRRRKGRYRALKGSQSNFSKLSESDVVELMKLRGTMPQSRAAARFGICRAAVGSVWRGKNWRWLTAA